jgi:hypothetical protein
MATVLAGYGLTTLAVGSVLLMAMHPTAGTHDVGEFVARAGHGVPGNTFVHGSLITVILLMTACFLWLRDALGARRILVRAGSVALMTGSSGLVAAGLINGFIVPNFSSHFVESGTAEVAALKPVLVFAREANASCARVGMVGLSLAAVAWSVCILGIPGWRRYAGTIGLICGVVPLVLHAADHMNMNVSGFGLFVQIHAVWAAIAGAVLIRHRSGTPAIPPTEEAPG